MRMYLTVCIVHCTPEDKPVLDVVWRHTIYSSSRETPKLQRSYVYLIYLSGARPCVKFTEIST